MNGEKVQYGILKRVKIEKMWGEKDIDINLNKVNLFVGVNGSGKTTFIKIIESVVSCDIKTLRTIIFESCRLYFDNDYTIICKKRNSLYNDISIQYIIMYKNEIKFNSDNYLRRGITRHGETLFHTFDFNDNLYEMLNKILKLTWISVERSVHDYRYREQRSTYEYEDRELRKYSNSVNGRLELLIKSIQTYKSNMESQEKEILEEFRNNIFELMLYDKKIDTIKHIKNPENDAWINQLHKAFNDLGLRSRKLTNKIDEHVKILKKAFQYAENDSNFLRQIALSLFNRTQEIIKYSQNAEEQRKNIRLNFEEYLSQVKNFLHKSISGINSTDLDTKIFNVNELSSGEKQTLILLSEAFLQNNEKVLFIADEPELSLHISWQRQIVSALTQLNPRAQIIFATHSPEVVAKWQDYVINMENIVKKSGE